MPAPLPPDAPLSTFNATPRRVVRWDLDKTYLHTDFDSFRGLLRAAVEKPETKRSVPGAAALIRVMRAERPTVLTIVSGSPAQMRQALESKLRLDGVAWDDFVLKPSLRNLVRLRFRALRDQVGYKLPALLGQRARAPADADREILFGDDAEADAFVYTLYGDILGGRVTDKLLTAVLEHAGTYPDVIDETIRRVHAVPRTDPVRRVFIHLERQSDPEFFRRYGPKVVPVSDYFQAALVLLADGELSAAGASQVAGAVAESDDRDLDDLLAGARDIVARGQCPRRPCAPSCPPCARVGACGRCPPTRAIASPTPSKPWPPRPCHPHSRPPRRPSTTSRPSSTTAPAGRPPATRPAARSPRWRRSPCAVAASAWTRGPAVPTLAG